MWCGVTGLVAEPEGGTRCRRQTGANKRLPTMKGLFNGVHKRSATEYRQEQGSHNNVFGKRRGSGASVASEAGKGAGWCNDAIVAPNSEREAVPITGQ